MTDGYIVKSDGKKFIFRGIGNWNDRKSQDVDDFDLPEESEENRILMRLSGAKREITFTFQIYDSDTDLADGTYTSQVKTIGEQIHYLMEVMFSPESDTYWTLYQDRYYPSGVQVAIESINLTEVGGEPNRVEGTITLIVGTVE